jgi:NADP-dependent 3-hydroxy acid dehydrogenase YdfG
VDLPRSPSFRLDGKRALVTGASSGIGLACAAALAEAGADVALVARRQEELLAVAGAIREAGGRASVHVLDITDLEATADLVRHEGPFDVLANAAGLARHSPAVETRPEDYDAAMGLNGPPTS